jgi:anaerobic ribonucleoside-triphosphate reductase activating protein
MRLGISRLHFPVTTLGPGRRIGIWLQGCSICCPGCISADTWGFGRGQTTVSDVVAAIEPWIGDASGLTISGGEPFDQPDALRELLKALRHHGELDVLVYSGYSFEHIADKLSQMAGLIDAIITDPFEVQDPQTLALRGSDNQRLHLLTDIGVLRFKKYERLLAADDHVLDLMFDENGAIWFAGIPRRGDMLRLQDLLSKQGHEIRTTQSTRRVQETK